MWKFHAVNLVYITVRCSSSQAVQILAINPNLYLGQFSFTYLLPFFVCENPILAQESFQKKKKLPHVIKKVFKTK